MDEYYCPNCGAILNNQSGFDPNNGTHVCENCGTHLMDDDVYDGDNFKGIEWRCDRCNALLNKQSGFSDSYGEWECTECGHRNGTTENEIVESSSDLICCPNCGGTLNFQSGYSDYSYDVTCEFCGQELHRNYSGDEFEIVDDEEDEEDEEIIECPNCGSNLLEQYGFDEYAYDWICKECNTKLHRNYSGDEFEIVDDEEDEEDEEIIECPNCDSNLLKQYGFDEYAYDWICKECNTKLHRNYAEDEFEIVDDEEDEEDEEIIECPNCGSNLLEQYGFNEYARDWICRGCNIKLHRETSRDEFEIVEEEIDLETKDEEVEDVGKSECREIDITLRSKSEIKKKRLKAIIFSRKRIKIGYNSEELKKYNYFVCYKLLQNEGFKKISLICKNDIGLYSKYKVHEVEKIVINGNSEFVSYDLVKFDSNIEIIYHEKLEIIIPYNSKYYVNKNKNSIINHFKELGFINLTEIPLRDLYFGIIKKENSIKSVTINGKKHFSKNSNFKFDAEIIIEYHSYR